MRTFLLLCGFLLLVALGSLGAEQLPEMRPALLGSGSHSLVNLIDTESLMKRGQTDTMVMFTCFVAASGKPYMMVTYRGTPNSNPLAEEIADKYVRALFTPAVYQHQNINGLISGTIIYRIAQGKPHLRIYLNQEAEHLKQGDDFISPQMVFVFGGKFKGIKYPEGIGRVSGTVAFNINVDAAGKLKSSKLVFETPPGKGFGTAVMSGINDATFLPGYLHGKPVACSATLQIVFRGGGRGTGQYWQTDQ
jgi:hypothetical protein